MIISSREGILDSRLSIYDLSADPESEPLSSVVIDVNSAANVRTHLLDETKILVEVIRSRTCEERQEYATKTFLADSDSETVITLDESQEPLGQLLVQKENMHLLCH